MSFQNLKVGELQELADFFAVEPEVADAEHGPTKKELLAALAEDEISKEDYETFLEAKASGKDKSVEEKRAEAVAEQKRLEEEAATVTEDDEPEEETSEPVADEDGEEKILVKYERKNPTYQVGEYTFYKDHPFLAVPASVAENLITSGEGFRQALPREVADYYN